MKIGIPKAATQSGNGGVSASAQASDVGGFDVVIVQDSAPSDERWGKLVQFLLEIGAKP